MTLIAMVTTKSEKTMYILRFWYVFTWITLKIGITYQRLTVSLHKPFHTLGIKIPNAVPTLYFDQNLNILILL